MKLEIGSKFGVPIQAGMMGLFFEDINYAADGGLYAEMIENRSFEFLKAYGNKNDYYVEYDGGYGWSPYPSAMDSSLKYVMGSPLSVENPHYMRVTAKKGCGFSNKAYDGISLKKNMEYRVLFFARNSEFSGHFEIRIEKDGKTYAKAVVTNENATDFTYNRFTKYEVILKANEDLQGGEFLLCLSEDGIVEFDFISMFPMDAVAGIFRKDLFDKLKELKPGFIRFPGGCIVEGNTLENRYRFKDSLKEPWNRKNNWNRWAVHGNCEENHFESQYSHYNQSMGLGFYEYFLLCELIGANPLPVLNVGFACQYQSEEMVAIDSPEFSEYLQDAIDLIEFANGDSSTKWGAIRTKMGHPNPFHLSMVGIGNEQWQTKKADFFERYKKFENRIHAYAPDMKLIGSAGPDITSKRYHMAWDFYHDNEYNHKFVYAVDEHYYVKPQWLYEHVDFYDNYSRSVKVFSGEYAAHPLSGMNQPNANNLEGALAEAAFLTGIERNADVVVLASYAPLFARVGYAQWSPDMIWFDGSSSYATPSYYVQKMYSQNMGTVTIDTVSKEKEAAKEGLFYSLSYDDKQDEIIVKVVNANDEWKELEIDLDSKWQGMRTYNGTVLSGKEKEDYNDINHQANVIPYKIQGDKIGKIPLPSQSFTVLRIGK